MTEEQWLRTDHLIYMLISLEDGLKGNLTARKLRLIAVGFCRQIWHLLSDESWRQFVITAELFADGMVSNQHLLSYEHLRAAESDDIPAATRAARLAAMHCLAIGPTDDLQSAHYAVLNASAYAAHAYALHKVPAWNGRPKDRVFRAAHDEASLLQCHLIRDIIGNPFRTIAVDPAWQTTTVTTLAQAIYADRTFEKMPILADALEETGCSDAAILDHCRQPGEHVRGCWVVDLLLNKQ